MEGSEPIQTSDASLRTRPKRGWSVSSTISHGAVRSVKVAVTPLAGPQDPLVKNKVFGHSLIVRTATAHNVAINSAIKGPLTAKSQSRVTVTRSCLDTLVASRVQNFCFGQAGRLAIRCLGRR